jgi:hypothetical protein
VVSGENNGIITRHFLVNLLKVKKPKYHIDIQIDKLTNSIVNTISRDSFQTEVLSVTKEDIKRVTKKAGWKFNWKSEAKLGDRKVFKLTIEGNRDVIQGLISISDYNDHIFMHLIESAPFNYGKPKLYQGVPGNLVAFACKASWEKGYDGFVAFVSKTKLIRHYEDSLGAHFIGGQRMAIGKEAAVKLINQYFKSK